MAKTNEIAYQATEEENQLIDAYLSGSATQAQVARLTQIYNGNADFRSYFSKRKAAFGSGMKQSGRAQRGIYETGRSQRPATGLDAYLRNQNYGNGRIVSPGGFKKSGRDEDSEMRREGVMTDANFLANNFTEDKDGRVTMGRGRAARRYTKGEMENIIARGTSGATMNWRDQAVYDAYVRNQTAARQEEDQRKARIRAIRDQGRMVGDDATPEQLSQLEWEMGEQRKREAAAAARQADREKRDLDLEYKLRESRAEADYRDQLKRKEEEDKRIAYNRQHGLADDYITQPEERKAVAEGRKTWGYSDRDQKEIDALDAVVADARRDPYTSEEDAARVERAVANSKAAFRKRLVANPDGPTPEQIAAQSKEYGGWLDAANTWHDSKAPSPEERRQTLEENRRIAAEKRDQDLKIRRLKFINDMVRGDRKAHDDRERANKEAFERFNTDDKKEYVGTPFDEKASEKAWAEKFDAAVKLDPLGAAAPDADEEGPQLCDQCGNEMVNGACVTPDCPANPFYAPTETPQNGEGGWQQSGMFD